MRSLWLGGAWGTRILAIVACFRTTHADRLSLIAFNSPASGNWLLLITIPGRGLMTAYLHDKQPVLLLECLTRFNFGREFSILYHGGTSVLKLNRYLCTHLKNMDYKEAPFPNLRSFRCVRSTCKLNPCASKASLSAS